MHTLLLGLPILTLAPGDCWATGTYPIYGFPNVKVMELVKPADTSPTLRMLHVWWRLQISAHGCIVLFFLLLFNILDSLVAGFPDLTTIENLTRPLVGCKPLWLIDLT